MSDHTATPHFQNDAGAREIAVGVKEFMCVGASPPLDHPHVFLDMGSRNDVACPYCATRFVYRASLGVNETDPPNHRFAEMIAG
ncbi:MAG: zinc-finger domain-containing protein [Bauldia sp.]